MRSPQQCYHSNWVGSPGWPSLHVNCSVVGKARDQRSDRTWSDGSRQLVAQTFSRIALLQTRELNFELSERLSAGVRARIRWH